MGTNVLIKESEKYGGQYVATRSFVDKDVISHGGDPLKVFNEAKDKGVNEPVVFYVPKKDVVQIYKNALR
jgi:hypothetical protein